jgi:hypothetical protein
MSDMAHQSCFITAIAFLKFDSPAPGQRPAESGPAKLKLFRVQTTLQFVILQHGINPAALFLDLLLLAAPADASAGTPRLTGLALPIIGSVLNTALLAAEWHQTAHYSAGRQR